MRRERRKTVESISVFQVGGVEDVVQLERAAAADEAAVRVRRERAGIL